MEKQTTEFQMGVASLLWRQYFLLSYFGKKPKTDGLFVHASCAQSEELDRKACTLAAQIVLFEKKAGSVVINGLPALCAYPGADVYLAYLHEYGVHDVIVAPEAKHTAAECYGMITMAKEYGWKSLTFITFPHHIPRTLSTWVECLKRTSSDLKVYPRTFDDVDWHMLTAKPTLDGETFSGTLFNQAEVEDLSYARYCNKEGCDEKGKFTPNATPEETVAYVLARDAN